MKKQELTVNEEKLDTYVVRMRHPTNGLLKNQKDFTGMKLHH